MKRYTARHKTDILRQLLLNAGDVALTSIQTGVPQSTLFRWKKQASDRKALSLSHAHSQLSHTPAAPPDTDDDSDPIAILRQRLIDHAFHISAALEDNLEEASLSQRALALSQLIDRIMKLSAIQPQEQVLHIVYEDPQDDPFYTPSSQPENDR